MVVPVVPALKSATVVSTRLPVSVVNVQVSAVPSAFAEVSVTDAATVTVYAVSASRSADGFSVAVEPAELTVAGTSAPAPWARSVNVEFVIVLGSIGSSNVTVTSVPIGTPVALGAGVRPVIVGGVVSLVAV